MTNSLAQFGLQTEPPQLRHADLNLHIHDKEEYIAQMDAWQSRMKQVQLAYFHQGRRAIILFEGWDAAGKGGAIRHITKSLDPRGFVVHPIGAPSAAEQGRHYFYRFVMNLPRPGTLAVFDRSYYGRVLVERIEGFASEREWQRAYREINEWERTLIDDEVRIVKIFMHISPQQQLQRFEERLNNPFKRWKLTEEDIRNRARWSEYELAIDEMFTKTSTERAPWHLIPANSKWFARIQALQTVVETLAAGVDINLPPIDPAVIAAAREKLGIHLTHP